MQDRKVSRRSFLKASIGLASTAGLVGGCSKKETLQNVLFIIVDDLNTALGCYGSSIVQTPYIDQLASNGVRFDHAYCQTPFCNPSRSSFLTGLRPNLTGVHDNKTSFKKVLPNAVTLPRLFRQHGFVTASVGKVFHKGKKGDPEAWGFREGGPGTNWNQAGERRNMTDGRIRWLLWVAAEGDDNELPDAVTTTKAISLLNTIDEPFFMAVGFKRPHAPFIAPKRYFDLYPLEKLPIHRLPDQRSQISPIAFGPSIGQLEDFQKFTDLDKKEFLRAYYACVSFIDDQVGRLLDSLSRLDLLKNTTIIFTSDHGYHLGDQDWWNKATLFESATKVPLIISTPKGQKGVSCTEFIELIDLYPTLADIHGLKPPNNMSGKSFKSLLTQPNTEFKDAAYSQIRFGAHTGYSIRTAHWRFTTWDMGAVGEELYDHTNDPHEYQNLALEPNHKAIVNSLKERIRNELNIQSDV